MADRHVIAIDLGGTKLAAALVGEDGTIGSRLEKATEQSDQDVLVGQLEDALSELNGPSVVALGIGIPSLIDQKEGCVGASVNVPLAGIHLRDMLEERFGVPVALENDANSAAVAEHRLGAGKGCDHMIMLTLGTGVGGGLILNGSLYRGAIGAAGELGHITLDIRSEHPCDGLYCPGYGHFESFAGGRAASRRANDVADDQPDGSLARARAKGRKLNGALLTELARAGEPDAVELMEAIGFDLGIGIASYVNIFNPEVVVVGGGFGEAGDLLLEPARRTVAERVFPTVSTVRIVEAELGPEAGLIGAGLVGFDLV
jgi:glucokinase